jgi:hypothetical protein
MNFNLKNYIKYPLIITSLYYIYHYTNILNNIISLFNVPSQLQGWLIMSIMGPIMTNILSTNNWIMWFQKYFMYVTYMDERNYGHNVFEWISMYLNKNKCYSSDSIIKVIYNQSSIWWDDTKTFSQRPQVYGIPSGWIMFKYDSQYLLAYFSQSENTKNDIRDVFHTVTIYSFFKVDWKLFIETVCNYYYDNGNCSKMIIYRNFEKYLDESEKKHINLRTAASIDMCFGNETKEKAWNTVMEFFNIETKNYFRKLNQPYKTAFLIYGPPGTGKTELLFQIASYTWKKYQKNIYIINPKGLGDSELSDLFNEIQSGYVLIDEWDLFLDKEGSGEKKNQYPSLNAWLNLLDHVNGEIIFWFTSNNYEKLLQLNNGALVRPGRIDHIFKFDNMMPEEVKKAYKIFSPNDDDIDNVNNEDLSGITIAEIINNLKKKLSINDLIIENKNKNLKIKEK